MKLIGQRRTTPPAFGPRPCSLRLYTAQNNRYAGSTVGRACAPDVGPGGPTNPRFVPPIPIPGWFRSVWVDAEQRRGPSAPSGVPFRLPQQNKGKAAPKSLPQFPCPRS